MNANELITGDWVRIKDLKDPIKRLVCVDEYLGKVDFLDGEELITTSINNVLPIPLTAEILERNGFEVQDQGGGRRDVWIGFGIDCEGDIEVEFQHNIPTHLKIDGVFKGEYYTSTNIKYVHLLQHALRLCGVEKEIVLNMGKWQKKAK